MEYQRKFRWANYNTLKCKEYLRNDFSHECAYCKLQEKEVGFVGSNYFEIDHYKPKSIVDPLFKPHVYNNLYYSCEKCNSEKSDIWSEILLDPCKDNVFSGDNPPVIGGYDAQSLYKYIATNDRGAYYINTFKLNSRYHIKIRMEREKHKNNIHQIDNLIDEILQKFNSKKSLTKSFEMINQLDQLRQVKSVELSDLSKNEYFEDVENYLLQRGIKHSIVFEEYNMDIKIKLNEISYYCELIVDDSETDNKVKQKYLEKEKLAVWFDKLGSEFGILYYYIKFNKLYFYPVSTLVEKIEIADFKSKRRISITEADLIK